VVAINSRIPCFQTAAGSLSQCGWSPFPHKNGRLASPVGMGRGVLCTLSSCFKGKGRQLPCAYYTNCHEHRIT
jgi:hypothetical protein